MKLNLAKLAMLAAMMTASASDVVAKNYALVHSEHLAKDDNMKGFVIDMVFTKLERGDNLIVTDGSGKEIARFTIPKGLKHDSLSKRKRLLRYALVDYLKWYDKVKRDGKYSLDIPAALNLIAEYDDKAQPTHVLVYGSIIHEKGRYAFVNEGKDGQKHWQYPNDNMLYQSDEHTWGTRRKTGAFRSMHVSFLYPQELGCHEDFVSLLKKFYSKWVSRQGGGVYSFTHDKKRAVATWLGSDKKAFAFRMDSPGGRARMIPFDGTDASLPEPDVIKNAIETYERRKAEDLHAGNGKSTKLVTAVMKSLSADTAKGEVSIALAWSQSVDYDLIAYVDGEKNPLHFGHRKAGKGAYTYLKDKRAAGGIQYEEIVLKNKPSSIEVWINLHQVNEKLLSPPTGEYLIAVDRVVYSGKFNFSVMRGDLGKDIRSRSNSPFWIKLNMDCLKEPRSTGKKKSLIGK